MAVVVDMPAGTTTSNRSLRRQAADCAIHGGAYQLRRFALEATFTQGTCTWIPGELARWNFSLNKRTSSTPRMIGYIPLPEPRFRPTELRPCPLIMLPLAHRSARELWPICRILDEPNGWFGLGPRVASSSSEDAQRRRADRMPHPVRLGIAHRSEAAADIDTPNCTRRRFRIECLVRMTLSTLAFLPCL